jgi:hypothetical protein
MSALSKSEIAALSTHERLALIDELWESLETQRTLSAADYAPVPEWHEGILDDRLLDLELFPGDEISRAEARRQSLL